MIVAEQSIPEKTAQFHRLLRACRMSIVRISVIIAVWGLLKGGLSGALMLYLYAAAASTLGMCVTLIVFLAIIFSSPRAMHPAVFSLVGMVVLGMMAYGVGIALGGNYLRLNSVQAMLITFAMLYGVPIGFYLRDMKPGLGIPASA